MKTFLPLAVIAALCLPAVAQSQAWITVVASSPVPQQSLTLNVSLPAGATYRFVSVNGKATLPITVTTAQTVSSWDDGGVGRPADPDPGIAKSMQILQSSAALSVSLIDSSVKPAKTTTVTVPALPPTIYKVSCTFPLPSTGPMPSTLTLTCGQAVKQ